MFKETNIPHIKSPNGNFPLNCNFLTAIECDCSYAPNDKSFQKDLMRGKKLTGIETLLL